MKKTVKLALEASDVALLDRQAEEKGVSRAELMRGRVLSEGVGKRFTPQDLSTIVSRVNRVSNLPRAEVERLVHTTFNAIMFASREEANPAQ